LHSLQEIHYTMNELGMIYANVPAWEQTRKFCRETLRKYGFGNRTAMEASIHEEIPELFKYMNQEREINNGHIHFSKIYFNLSFLNLTGSMIIGKRHSFEDPKFNKLLQDSLDFIKGGLLGISMMAAYPFLRYVFPAALGYNTQMRAVQGIQRYAKVFNTSMLWYRKRITESLEFLR